MRGPKTVLPQSRGLARARHLQKGFLGKLENEISSIPSSCLQVPLPPEEEP